MTILNAPFEDQLYWTNRRVPKYWSLEPLNSSFTKDLKLYLVLNFVRQISLGAAWTMVCMEMQPRVTVRP